MYTHCFDQICLITDQVYSSDRRVWPEPIIFAGLISHDGEFFGGMVVNNISKVNMDSMKVLETSTSHTYSKI